LTVGIIERQHLFWRNEIHFFSRQINVVRTKWDYHFNTVWISRNNGFVYYFSHRYYQSHNLTANNLSYKQFVSWQE